MTLKKTIYLYLLIVSMVPLHVKAQQKAEIYGVVKDSHGKPLELVNVSIMDQPGGTITNQKGEYKLFIPANTKNIVVVSYMGFASQSFEVTLKEGSKRELNVSLKTSEIVLPGFDVEEKRITSGNIIKIDPKDASKIPTVSGGVESLIKTRPGVTSTSELSSQYNVRGGNFDENLVYVNDIQIYRPFLIRSGEQEGLSFVNSELVSSISFSAGGFDAKYGDKMSSVLDITYKKPKEFAGSATASLMGASVHLEGASKSENVSYLLGVRRKSNQYVLNSLQTKGDYRPTFTDIQLYTTYNLNERLELAFLGHYSNNKFKMVPETRETSFGTLQEAYKLTVYFDGQEVDAFETMTGAFSANYKATEKLDLKFIASAFNSYESETYDIMGQYWLDELETDFGQDDFGEEAFNKGIGTYLNHARNNLIANVISAEHKANYKAETGIWDWGIKYNYEDITDELSEWSMLDSAGYSIPHHQDSIGYTDPSLQPNHTLELKEVINANIALQSNRFSGYMQRKWFTLGDSYKLTFTAGVRSSYWDLNNEVTLSPRASVIIDPDWEKDYKFRIAAGMYHQPPFYRELRYFDGSINKDVKAQQSIHFLVASDYLFKAWGRPFKYTTEIYYKKLDNLIPYEIDNVRIRYYADNMSHGYATGIDMKINGEFVKSIESWASLSLLQTQEDIEGDIAYHYYNTDGERIKAGVENKTIADSAAYSPGYVARPTDRRFNFSLFFQDYLPKNPTYKMHLNFVYGSGLPFGPPSFERHKDTLRMPPYFRVDIGFSKQLIGEGSKNPTNGLFKHFKSLWLTAEVFNLLQNYNTISYLWIKDIENRNWPVPNYLTTRRINVKLIAKF